VRGAHWCCGDHHPSRATRRRERGRRHAVH
jgi:hypothetical protein